jgi:hypothetical protein
MSAEADATATTGTTSHDDFLVDSTDPLTDFDHTPPTSIRTSTKLLSTMSAEADATATTGTTSHDNTLVDSTDPSNDFQPYATDINTNINNALLHHVGRS